MAKRPPECQVKQWENREKRDSNGLGIHGLKSGPVSAIVAMSQSKATLPPSPIEGDDTIYWVGSAEEDLAAFPFGAKQAVGFALRFAQRGVKHPSVNPLKGYAGAGVLEVIKPFDKDTYRAIYTVRYAGRVYVLHCFQKKSSPGIATPEREMRVIRARLQQVEKIHTAWLEDHNG